MTTLKTCHAMYANVTLMAAYLAHAGEAVACARRSLEQGNQSAAIGALFELDVLLDHVKTLREAVCAIHSDSLLFNADY